MCADTLADLELHYQNMTFDKQLDLYLTDTRPPSGDGHAPIQYNVEGFKGLNIYMAGDNSLALTRLTS